MNPRGKHFIDAVDPEENSQENTLQQQVSDVAEPASTQRGAGVDSASDAQNGAQGEAVEQAEASVLGADDAPKSVGETEWPSIDEAAPQRRRRSEESIKRIKRRRRIRTLLIVLLVIGAVAAAGWGFVNHSVNQGKKKIEEKTEKVIKAKGDTITYNGKKYELNKHMATVAFIGFDGRDNDDGTQKGQSDTVMVVALNTDTGEARGIVIPRDSMVAVDTYSNGSFAGQVTEQLCLQFAYGTDGDNSSALTAAAASRVLDNIPVDYYYTLNIEGVAPINDSIGGVTLVPTQTVPGTSVVEGQETTLFGTTAEKYVQWRDTTNLTSSLDRTARQVSYVQAFASKVLSSAKSNPAMLISLYQAMGDYTWTNLGLDEFSYLATTMLEHGLTSFDVVTLQGTMQQGDTFAEFYLDQDNVKQTVVDTFYHPVN
ncbi:MAG: LCP family protein [Collinsella sp.]